MLQNLIIFATVVMIGWLLFRAPSVKVPPGAYRVVDGDGININYDKIRIIGFDAPEWNQPGGSEATAALTALLRHGFTVKPSGERDRYGRILARLIVKRRRFGLPLPADVAFLMLKAGHGHCDARGWQWLGAHGRAELTARICNRGLWDGAGIMGWRAMNPKYWRKQQQGLCAIAYQTGNSKPAAEPRHKPLPRFKPKRPMFPRDL